MTSLTDSPTLEEAQDRFLADIQRPNTRQTYRNALTALYRFMDETHYAGHKTGPPHPIALLGDDVLVEFYRWLVEGYSSHSVQTYLAAVQRFLVWLDAADLLPLEFQLGKAQSRLKAAQGKRGRQPYKHRRPDPELPRIVTYYDELPLPEGNDSKSRSERLRILRNRAIVHTLYASAGRVSEVTSLTRDMVLDGRHDEVHLTGKGGLARVILLTPQALAAIREYLAVRTDDQPGLFISHGNRSRGKPLGRRAVWAVVKEAARALDLHHKTSPHAFRHYRATQLLNQNMPLELVQAYLGHADIATTRKVYAHTQTSFLRQQLEAYDQSPEEALAELEERHRQQQDSSS